jgi:biopolymer transport protein ExbB
MFEFYKELAKGGWVMIPIGAVSVLALGLFLERIFTLRRSRVFPLQFVMRIRELILGRKFSEALVVCERNGSSIALVIAAGLMRQGDSREQIKEAVEERGRAEAGRLDRFIEGLGTIAAIAPLLGLLGTVLGMIDVFRIVDDFTKANPGSPVDPGLLATGIWKALITTAAGLVVAIPTFVGYKYLVTRINRLVLEMEESAADLTDLFIRIQENEGLATGPTQPMTTGEAPPAETEGDTEEETSAKPADDEEKAENGDGDGDDTDDTDDSDDSDDSDEEKSG